MLLNEQGVCGTRHVLLYSHPGSCHARLVGLVRSRLGTGWFGRLGCDTAACASSLCPCSHSCSHCTPGKRGRGVSAWKCAVCRIQGTEHCFWSLCHPEGHRDTDTCTAGLGLSPVPTVGAPAWTGSWASQGPGLDVRYLWYFHMPVNKVSLCPLCKDFLFALHGPCTHLGLQLSSGKYSAVHPGLF